MNNGPINPTDDAIREDIDPMIVDDEDDFDGQDEFDAIPEGEDDDENITSVMDGDFLNHPFRGNQHVKASRESGSAVHASKKAKRAQGKGDLKALKSAHRGAYHAHKAALEGATGKAKSYHRIMAKFHGKHAGERLDDASEPVLDANAGLLLDAAGNFDIARNAGSLGLKWSLKNLVLSDGDEYGWWKMFDDKAEAIQFLREAIVVYRDESPAAAKAWIKKNRTGWKPSARLDGVDHDKPDSEPKPADDEADDKAPKAEAEEKPEPKEKPDDKGEPQAKEDPKPEPDEEPESEAKEGPEADDKAKEDPPADDKGSDDEAKDGKVMDAVFKGDPEEIVVRDGSVVTMRVSIADFRKMMEAGGAPLIVRTMSPRDLVKTYNARNNSRSEGQLATLEKSRAWDAHVAKNKRNVMDAVEDVASLRAQIAAAASPLERLRLVGAMKAARVAPPVQTKLKKVTKKEAREAYDSLSYAYSDLQGHTATESERAGSESRLQREIDAVKALIARGWPDGVNDPFNLILSAEKMIARIVESRAAGGAKEIGRGDALSYYLNDKRLTPGQVAAILDNPVRVIKSGTIDVPRYNVEALKAAIAAAIAANEVAPEPAKPSAAAREVQGAGDMFVIKDFMSRGQKEAIRTGMRGEEADYFIDKMAEMRKVIETMPATYGQDGKGDQAIAHLHYFKGSGDWWITEKDKEGGVDQAFGLADLGHGGELGYISIRELVQNGVELDLHWTPKTLAQIKGKDESEPAQDEDWARKTMANRDHLPWADVEKAKAILGIVEPSAAEMMAEAQVTVTRRADLATLAQIEAGTHPDMLEPEIVDVIENILDRFKDDEEVQAAGVRAIEAYSAGMLAAT